MDIEFRKDFSIQLYGVPGVAENQDWAGTGMALMQKMWDAIRSRGLENPGINYWVYEPGNAMYSGAELSAPPPADSGLEPKSLQLADYVHCVHLGPYNKIPETHSAARAELDRQGVKVGLPYMEIYGHWDDDPSKLTTELIWNIKSA